MALADLLKSSGTYVKWDERGMGKPVTGSIISIVDRQPRKYMSEELDCWDDGTAKFQWIITIATDERYEDNPEDDGTRVVVVNQWSGQKKAMSVAMREYGQEPEAGDSFTATWSAGVGKAGDPRVFEYSFKKEAPASIKKLTKDTPAAPAESAWVAPTETPNKADEAKALLAAGIEPADVAEATGLSMKIVNALAAAAA